MSGYFTDTTNLALSVDQAITATADSTNVIDCGATPTLRDLGICPVYVEVVVTEAFNNLTSLAIAVKSDSTTNLDTSETVHATATPLLAALTLGARFILPIPVGQNVERYLGIEYTVTGTAPTTGKVTAVVVPHAAPSMQYFADASSISV